MKKSKPSKYAPRARTKGKKNIRGRFPALDPSKNLKIRQEMMEGMDYAKDLTEKQKKWLDKFMDGYNNANVRKKTYNSIHKRSKDKSICHAINNSRNKDAYAKAKAKNFLLYDNVPDFWIHADEITNYNSHEDTTIALLDAQTNREIVCEKGVSFISEVKEIQRRMPDMLRSLRAASSMVKTFLNSVANGEMPPDQLQGKIEEATGSLIELQGSEADVSIDTSSLVEKLSEYPQLIQDED